MAADQLLSDHCGLLLELEQFPELEGEAVEYDFFGRVIADTLSIQAYVETLFAVFQAR